MEIAMHELLRLTATVLNDYLEKRLPNLGAQWWQTRVKPSLSPAQIAVLDRRGAVGLSALDLASLLKVMDRNWHDLTVTDLLTSEDRSFLKEMQSVRNRWAHESADSMAAEDLYRDLDTLQRFMGAIQASQAAIDKVREAKMSVMKRMNETTVAPSMSVASKPSSPSRPLNGVDARGMVVQLDAAQHPKATRQWTGNDCTARNHHGAVRLDETPLVLCLRWRKSASAPIQPVGTFKLDLSALLSAGYVQRDAQAGCVRLRFWHGEDDGVYIQASPSAESLRVGSVTVKD
jgi:hypothetical protein